MYKYMCVHVYNTLNLSLENNVSLYYVMYVVCVYIYIIYIHTNTNNVSIYYVMYVCACIFI